MFALEASCFINCWCWADWLELVGDVKWWSDVEMFLFPPVRSFKISWSLANKANSRAACFRWRQAPNERGISKRGRHGHVCFHFLVCCLWAVFCFGEHWVSHAGVKEGVQTEGWGMFTQPEYFPQGEDAFWHYSRGERSKQLLLYPPGSVTVMF